MSTFEFIIRIWSYWLPRNDVFQHANPLQMLTLYCAFKTIFLYDTCLPARVQHDLRVHLRTAWSFNLGCGVFVVLLSLSMRENVRRIMTTTETAEYVNIFLVFSDAVKGQKLSLHPRSALWCGCDWQAESSRPSHQSSLVIGSEVYLAVTMGRSP